MRSKVQIEAQIYLQFRKLTKEPSQFPPHPRDVFEDIPRKIKYFRGQKYRPGASAVFAHQGFRAFKTIKVCLIFTIYY